MDIPSASSIDIEPSYFSLGQVIPFPDFVPFGFLFCFLDEHFPVLETDIFIENRILRFEIVGPILV